MKLSSKRIKAELKSIEELRRRCLTVILRTAPLIVGSVYRIKRRCGNPSCHCVAGAGHDQTILTFSIDAKRGCQAIRKNDILRIKSAARVYKACRTAFKQLRTLQIRELKILGAYIKKRSFRYR